jgi:hypothetical protein
MIAAGQSDVGADPLLSGPGGNHPAIAPLLQDAYHSTIHSAMGYSPCQLLFGWMPQDLRVPLVAAELITTDISKNVDAWLELCKEHLKHAKIDLEYARTAMMKARNTGEKGPTGDNVNSVMKQVASMVKVFNHAGETEFVSVAKHVQQYGERV